jgi:hypothetical protein
MDQIDDGDDDDDDDSKAASPHALTLPTFPVR